MYIKALVFSLLNKFSRNLDVDNEYIDIIGHTREIYRQLCDDQIECCVSSSRMRG